MTEVDEELAALVEAGVDDLVARGLSEEDARAEMIRRLGPNIESVRRRLQSTAAHRERRMRFSEWVDSFSRDVRLGVRQLMKAPGVTIVAILSLAFGVGANGAIFSLLDALLVRPLPVSRPQELVAIGKITAIDGHTTGAPRGDLFSWPQYRDLLDEHRVVTGLAASGVAPAMDVVLPSGDPASPEHPIARFVSGNYFDVLGVGPSIGRLFGRSEDGPIGSAPVVVLSNSYWRTRFGASPDVIGARISIDGAVLTIIGVGQRGFDGDIVERPTQLWIPIPMQPIVEPHSAPITDRGTSWLLLLGRLAPGATVEQARATFTTRIRQSLLANAGIDSARLRRAPVRVASGAQGFSAARVTLRPVLISLQTGVALLLLIVCANLASLFTARGLARRVEMSIRVALGANRGRLVRQLMTEHALIAVAGGVCALAVAWWSSVLLARTATAASVAPDTHSLGLRSIAFVACSSIVALIGFGIAPVLQTSRFDLATSLRSSARSVKTGGASRRVPIGALLIPAQIVLCVVLLLAAALLTKSLWNLQAVDAGLDRDHLLVVQADPARRGITGERFIELAGQVSRRISAVPGVRGVTFSQNGLYFPSDGSALVAVPGFVGRTQDDSLLNYDLVGAGYLHVIGARLLQGRDIDATDVANAPSVAVLNESAARFLFPRQSAIGRRIYFDAGVPTTIVGVVADVRDHSLVDAGTRRAYAPYAQQISNGDVPTLTFEIRTASDPSAMVAAVRVAVAEAAPGLPQRRVVPVQMLIQETIRAQRVVAFLGSAFGGAALLLAALGLYGVMSYATARRTPELGLRGALGAQRGDLIWLVLRDAARLTVLGLVPGAGVALAVAAALRSQLHDISATNPAALGFVAVTIVVCTTIAALIPALRAARVSPLLALNHDV